MPEHPIPYTIRELRQRYLLETKACSDEILREMKNDSRRGVRQIYQQLLRKQERKLAEMSRLDQMMTFERTLWSAGIRHIAGVDEAGMGPLAGPVVAAAVIFPPETRISGIDDSKRLDTRTRSKLAREIRQRALSVSVGISEVEEIDRLNIYQAGLLAMRRAVEGLRVKPEYLLVDGRTLPGLPQPQQPLVKGDQRSFFIAAASIIAKTHRDQLMCDLNDEYPGYGFARNKGYGTAEHRRALKRLGPAAPHRRSFSLSRESSGRLFDDSSR